MVDAAARARTRQRRAVTAAAPARAVTGPVDDAGPLQRLQVEALADELIAGAERVQDYGFASHPHPGAEAVLNFAGGARNHPLVIAVADRRYRLKGLASGEVAIHDDQGQVVHLKRDGIAIATPHDLAIEAGGMIDLVAQEQIRLAAPQVTIEAPAAFDVTAGTIGMVAAGLARLAGNIARLHGIAQVAWDALGVGFSFTPAARRYHYTGTTASELPPAPPEVP
jgi:phage baseplate assembly protein V